jgi:hypothetical protein
MPCAPSSATQVLSYSSTQLLKYSATQVLSYSSTQLLKYSTADKGRPECVHDCQISELVDGNHWGATHRDW